MSKHREHSRRRISAKEISIFCAQAAMLLEAGIPLDDGLVAGMESSGDKDKLLMFKIAAKIEETGSLYEGVACVGVFPVYMVQMIHIGETVGKLEEVLLSLSAHYNREEKIQNAVRGAIMYPVIMILLMSAVIALLVVLVLPVFSQVLETLGESATDTKFINAGTTMGKAALTCVAAVLAIAFIVFILSLFSRMRARIVRLCSSLPIINKLYAKIASGRFAYIMSAMLTSGFNIDKALQMSQGVIADKSSSAKIEQCRKKVESGKQFSVALAEVGLFSDIYLRMVQTGERAGRLDEVMSQLAEKYGDEIDNSLSALIAIIEPTLVAVLSIIIGAILMSVMLPLVEIMSLIG